MKFTSKLKTAIFCFMMVGAATFAQVPAQEKVEVSDAELGKIANAFKGIQQVNAQAQQEMVKTVEESGLDRKSTRLNSSHVKISYAVFCLKKKKQKKQRQVE